MAGQRILLVARDRIGIHALEEIVALVVFADVVETEVPVLFRVLAALGRAVRPLVLALRPLAHGGFFARAACCFALSLLGLMRMLSKNLDESIGMADYDNAMRKASSLDIANTSLS